MQISQHYLPYPKKTLIVVTNNELAKIHAIHNTEIEELKTIKPTKHKNSEIEKNNEIDEEELKKNKRKELYIKLDKALIKLLKTDYEDIIICSPEARKNEITEAMRPATSEHIIEVVPKNLASLPLDAIIRILQETRIA